MKDIVLAAFLIPGYLLLATFVILLIWSMMVPTYERFCAVAWSRLEPERGYPPTDIYEQSRKMGKKMLVAELLRSGLGLGLLSLILSLFTPFALGVFCILGYLRLSKLSELGPVDPETWCKPLFIGLHCLFFSVLCFAVGAGATYLIFGSL